MGGANEKGVYNWVTALQIAALYSTKVHFVMHSATTATEHLQTYAKHVYAEPLSPQKMTSHAQLKGVTIIRHNEVCDLTAIRLAEVWQ